MIESFQGSLFSSDFLTDSIARMPDWNSVSPSTIGDLRNELATIFTAFPTHQTPNEAQTEDDLIWKVLKALGWNSYLRQQNLAVRGREDVPDGLLFGDEPAKQQANRTPEEWRRYQFGLALVESKRWNRPLDRRSGRRGEETAPSAQMLRYLRRVEDLSTGKLRWGILTNGARWRLYYQGARSVAENFCEVDLAQILDIGGHEGGLFSLTDEQRLHALKVFFFLFRRTAFVGTPTDARTFHQRALAEGRFYEERVASNLSDLVFGHVFPRIVQGIAKEAPDAPLQEVREASLILLYRLLFVLYAEDRDLLPIRDRRYAEYALRDKVRQEVGTRKSNNDAFSDTAARYWSTIDDLARAIDTGDTSIGLPPYNGGLFDRKRTPLLSQIRLPDTVMADVIDALSFDLTQEGRRYINYRDLSVQQLGSIYERLLEHEVIDDGGPIVIRPNIFARRTSGSYYTHDDLVALIIKETIGPLIQKAMEAFELENERQAASDKPLDQRLGVLKRSDPAERFLSFKICDPAMGSGHFLVSLVDYLADQITTAMAEAEAAVEWAEYVSPLSDRIDAIRNTILGNAESRGWVVDTEQLDDRHIIRRMILKRCVYGVDKNLMAVELAKVSLWLHTFTVGAPLSFLDHHLRCGDSLFGLWVDGGFRKASVIENVSRKSRADRRTLFLHEPMMRALRAAAPMQIIEGLTDAEIAEAHRSADIFLQVREMTAPLTSLLSFFHALDWFQLNSPANRTVLQAFLSGVFGDPVQIVLGNVDPLERNYDSERGRADALTFASILSQTKELIAQEHFLHWQVAFPGVWSEWERDRLVGGFDAIIGNPPWDRMKIEQIEWFAARRPSIALAQRAADRAQMIADMKRSDDPLARDYEKAEARAEAAVRTARRDGEYPLLSRGDVNIYSLFIERSMKLVKKDGMVGLLTPSGIASDKTASQFFKSVSTTGRLRALFDFENRGRDRPAYFRDVHAQFKFCALIVSQSALAEPARCAFFLNDPSEIENPERCFQLTPADFARLNPNTGTAPLFRHRQDAAITTGIYGRIPVLVDRSSGQEVKTWPVAYSTAYHMTNDSELFRTEDELTEQEGAYPIGRHRFRSTEGDWIPLYEGKMVWHFDHRAASVVVNKENQYRPAFPRPTELGEHRDPSFSPTPQFWVLATDQAVNDQYALAFRDVTNPTDRRTMDACFIPHRYAGNTLPMLTSSQRAPTLALLCANLNATILDFVARQKVQKNHLNWYIVEQLPIVPQSQYDLHRFGRQSAAEVARAAVLELTYTAYDLAPFARDMGYVDDSGSVRAPFVWNENRRKILLAKLDALFFHLYGVTDRAEVRYIFSTFGVVERDDLGQYGRYLSRDLCLAWMNALAAGDPDADIQI